MGNDLWAFPETVGRLDVTGFDVEATDGSIGKVDESSNEAGAGFFIVKEGIPILGKKIVIPAGLVDRVDRDTETLYVTSTKDEIKGAPEFDDDAPDQYRSATTEYWGAKLSRASPSATGSPTTAPQQEADRAQP